MAYDQFYADICAKMESSGVVSTDVFERAEEKIRRQRIDDNQERIFVLNTVQPIYDALTGRDVWITDDIVIDLVIAALVGYRKTSAQSGAE